MKTNKHFRITFFCFLHFFLLGLPQSIMSQEISEDDKTLSPYFFVMSNDTSIDQLPLKSTSASVEISGVIADVTVNQVYCNEGDSVLEAIYVFPASTKAAVYAMEMIVGDRLLKAKIKEKEEAREEYEEAKEEGKTVSLLEQERPNVFQMNVANILPGDTIVLEMKYTELIVPEEGIYEFVYPTVVGPRYASPNESEEGIEWVASPYQHEDEEPFYDFDIDVFVNAGLEISSLESPSHTNLEIQYVSLSEAVCGLPEEDKQSGNKDFILDYSLSGNGLESGLLLFEGDEENFFLAMVQPPRNPTMDQIPPREYVFIMDVSGSMHGFPIDVSKTLLTDLISNLRSYDKFNMLFFAGGNYLLSDNSLYATQENLNLAIDAINNQQGGGGTEILSALERALALPGNEDFARVFVIATDGYVSVEKQAFDLIRNNLSEANFFSFGIGSSVNRYIIEGMAHVGMGEPMVAINQEQALEKADKFRTYIESPVLTNIDVDIDDFDVYDVEPITVPDVFAERPVLLFGKWRGEPNGTISISGLSGDQVYTKTLDVSGYQPAESNSALKYLWARHKIQLLSDYGSVSYYQEGEDSIKNTIIELGLKYSLLTEYTSFIAVDSVIRNTGGSTTVSQPLPMPSGVSDNAVGDGSLGFGNTVGLSPGYSKLVNEDSGRNTEVTFIEKTYPNPVKESINVILNIGSNDALKKMSLVLFNTQGQKLFSFDLSNYQSGLHELEINFLDYGLDLNSGIYYFQLRVDGQIKGKMKFVKY